jgi:hypothetical protein
MLKYNTMLYIIPFYVLGLSQINRNENRKHKSTDAKRCFGILHIVRLKK